jgi:flagellin
MGLRINTNTDALDAYRNLSMTQSKLSDSLQKLSSGYRINKAADDAAGLSISEGLQAQIGGLTQAVKNAQDGINVVQTADGALTEVDSILQRMNDLAVQASNTGSQDTTARQAAQTELSQLNTDLDNIGGTTQFGQSKLLDGTFGSANKMTGTTAAWANKTIVAGTNDEFKLTTTVNGSSQTLNVKIAAGVYTSGQSLANATNGAIKAALQAVGGTGSEVAVQYNVNTDGTGGDFTMTGSSSFSTALFAAGNDGSATYLGIADGASAASGSGGVFQIGAEAGQTQTVQIGGISSSLLGTSGIDLVNNASGAISTIATAIQSVSTERANLGAFQNGFQHTINNLNVTVENLQASNSSIQDTDMASQMVMFTQQQVLQQAGVSMLAQANSESQSVLKLLG